MEDDILNLKLTKEETAVVDTIEKLLIDIDELEPTQNKTIIINSLIEALKHR